jgi:hypothetical protein
LRPAIGFADVRANLQRLQIVNRLAALVALVGDDFLNHRDRAFGDLGNRFELLSGLRERFLNRGRVALVGALHRAADDRARLEINRVLGLVWQVRSARPSSSWSFSPLRNRSAAERIRTGAFY